MQNECLVCKRVDCPCDRRPFDALGFADGELPAATPEQIAEIREVVGAWQKLSPCVEVISVRRVALDEIEIDVVRMPAEAPERIDATVAFR
jgi:hypothetical protein